MSIKCGLEYIGYLDPWTDEERLSDEEIIRCRDCIHFSEGMGTHVWLCERMEYLDLEGWTKNVRVDPNGFCAWGERRDA